MQLYKIIYQSAYLNEVFTFESISDNFIYELCKNVQIKKITTTYEARYTYIYNKLFVFIYKNF